MNIHRKINAKAFNGRSGLFYTRLKEYRQFSINPDFGLLEYVNGFYLVMERDFNF
jgi:hypothetical protein